MNRRIRQWFGIGLVAAGVVVAIVGYLGVSAETEVAFQLPYFASAAVGSLLLIGLGGAMLVSSQLERDTDRIDDLVEAVRALSAEVGRLSTELTENRGRARMRLVSEEASIARHPANGTPRVRRAR